MLRNAELIVHRNLIKVSDFPFVQRGRRQAKTFVISDAFRQPLDRAGGLSGGNQEAVEEPSRKQPIN
jgi:hypothetical protein